MEWFDTDSIATLFGVDRHTVLRWIWKGKLAAVRHPFYVPMQVSEEEDSDSLPDTKRRPRVRLTQHLVSRPHLEEFLITEWSSAHKGHKRVTIEDLIHLGQLTGEIAVTVEPELDVDVDRRRRVMESMRRLIERRRPVDLPPEPKPKPKPPKPPTRPSTEEVEGQLEFKFEAPKPERLS